jgi:hypothetical protein
VISFGMDRNFSAARRAHRALAGTLGTRRAADLFLLMTYGIVEPERLLRRPGGRPREDARNAALAAIVEIAGIKQVRLMVRLGLLASGDVSSNSPIWGWFSPALVAGRELLALGRPMSREAEAVVSLVHLRRDNPHALVDELSPLLRRLPGIKLGVEQIRDGLREELRAAADST